MLRMFSNYRYKGTYGYLNTQKKYELLRTILYFGISISLFVAGYIATKSKENLLTVVAVLGCLPASKSLVSTIMFFRFQSMEQTAYEQISKCGEGLSQLSDLVFTTYDKNYQVDHLVVKGNVLCGYSSHPKFDANACEEHIQNVLKQDGYKNYTVKMMTDLTKYENRLEQLQSLEGNEKEAELLELMKSVTL